MPTISDQDIIEIRKFLHVEDFNQCPSNLMDIVIWKIKEETPFIQGFGG